MIQLLSKTIVSILFFIVVNNINTFSQNPSCVANVHHLEQLKKKLIYKTNNVAFENHTNPTAFFGSINVIPPILISESHSDVTCYGFTDGAIDINVSGGLPPYTFTWTKNTSIAASKDNTIFSENNNVSNALGNYLFSGITNNGFTNPLSPRRALIAFDIASYVPAGSSIELAALNMNINAISINSNGGDSLGLHKLNQNWGEGTSINPGIGGFGVPVTTGDASWLYSYYPDTLWSNGLGGNFETTASDKQSADTIGPIIWNSTQVKNDVQDWYVNPSSNFGWAIVGNELNDTASAKRMFSRHFPDPLMAPNLQVYYSIGHFTEDVVGIAGGKYTVIVTDASGGTLSLTVLVNEPAQLNATITTAGSTAYCPVPGEGVLLESVIAPNVTKQWLKGGSPIAGATGDTYLAQNAAGFKLVVTDTGGCTASGNTITTSKLTRPPSNITVIGNTTFCGGDSAILEANTGPYTYQWLRYGRILAGRTNSSLVAKKGGNYKVQVTDALGCYRVSALTVLDKNQSPLAFVSPNTANLPSPICVGDSILLTANGINGHPPYTYQWYRYNTLLAGKTSNTYLSTTTGGYSVRIVDTRGCADKSKRTVINETCRLGGNDYELSNNLNVAAYPNPFQNEVILALNNFTDENVRIIIRDAVGRLVYEIVDSPQFEYTLNTSAYKSGLYVIELYQGHHVQRIKMIKSE